MCVKMEMPHEDVSVKEEYQESGKIENKVSPAFIQIKTEEVTKM